MATDGDSGGLHWRPVAIALVLCGFCMLVLVEQRGLWFDEFWTIFLSRHDAPLAELFRTRWGPDVHPPPYTFYTWALAPLTGETKAAMRLTNLAGILFLALTCFGLRRRFGARGFLPILLLLIGGSPFFVTYFAEYRSYFIELCAAAVVILQLHAIHFLDRDLDFARDKLLAVACMITFPAAASLHFTSGALILVFIGTAFLYLCLRRRPRAAAVLLIGGALALAGLVAAYAIALHFNPPPAPNRPGALKGMAILLGMAAAGTCANLAAVGVAAMQPRFSGGNGAARDYPWLLAATVGAGVLAMALLNALSPFLTMRYAIALIAPGAALTAWLARGAIDRPRWALTLIAANAVILALAVTVQQSRNRRWETFAPVIAKVAARCPGTPVLALYSPYLSPYFSDDGPDSVENNHQVFISGYRYLARRYGFQVREVPDPSGAVTPVSTRPCPTLVWIEHNVLWPTPTVDHILATARLRPPPGTSFSMLRSRYGVLLTIRPGG